MSSSKPPSVAIDILTATASHLRSLLEFRAVTSVDLVDICLAQIKRHNRQRAKLHAMISVADQTTLGQIAQKLTTKGQQIMSEDLYMAYHSLSKSVEVVSRRYPT